jgi:hypothetical protein
MNRVEEVGSECSSGDSTKQNVNFIQVFYRAPLPLFPMYL